jgi:hypothetical protein
VFPKSERFYNLLFLKKIKFFHFPLDRSNIGCPFSFMVAKDYVYRGQELAVYLWRDPSAITRYLKEGNRLGSEVENVHAKLRRIAINKPDPPPKFSLPEF